MSRIFRYILQMRAFLLLFFLTVHIAGAQIWSFSPEPAVFIKEFEAHIQSASSKELNQRFAIFRESWEMGKFSPVQQKNIMAICSDMVSEGMPVQPHFDYLLQSITIYLEKKMPEKVLLQWQQATRKLIGTASTGYVDFLKMTTGLFKNGTLLADNNKRWAIDSCDFDLIYDKGEIVVKFPSTTLTCYGPVDKMRIYNTAGIFIPGKKMWQGLSGEATFERVLPEDNVTVSWNKFAINLEESDYKIDSATLQYEGYFREGVKGRFQDKISYSPDSVAVKKSPWPRFSSFANSLQIFGIVGPNASLRGGFSMVGSDINTQTANGEETVINILYKTQK
ncbi:MAG: hypothetical protein EBV15_02725, partial [Bacteroidetes bacterium]|nr:hypothetical protein [Bacteroidota bacterium]